MAEVVPPTPDRFAHNASPGPVTFQLPEGDATDAPRKGACHYVVPVLVGVTVAVLVLVLVHVLRKRKTNDTNKQQAQKIQYAATRPYPRNVPAFPASGGAPPQPPPPPSAGPEAFAGAGTRFSAYQPGDAQRPSEVTAMLDKRYNQPSGIPYNDNRMGAYDSYSEAVNNQGRVQHLDEEAFNKRVLQQKQPALVAFVMNQCGHCERLKPNFDQAAANAKIALVMVERAQAGALPQKYGVRGFPTIALFRGGELVKMYSGDRSAQSLAEFANA